MKASMSRAHGRGPDGNAILGEGDERIGEISELVVDPNNGDLQAALVDVGGFLGIGERQVAVPMDQLSIQRMGDTDEVEIFSDLTAEDLEAMPEYPQQ
jgi:hypothetical protein